MADENAGLGRTQSPTPSEIFAEREHLGWSIEGAAQALEVQGST
jgi:hypothetical protein